MRHMAAVTGEVVWYRRGQSSSRILDLGCGDGTRAIALASRPFNQVVGLDSNKSLIDVARQKAVKRRADVAFICGHPRATPFEAGTFDEVMLLGGLFGHSPAPKYDVELLREAGRVLKAGGRLHLSFSDAEWIRRCFRPDVVEGLPAGFIYRHHTLSADGHSLHTNVVAADEGGGTLHRQTQVEWLYAPREVTDLLCRLGFEAITYDDAVGKTSSRQAGASPRFVVHCRASHRTSRLRLVSPT